MLNHCYPIFPPSAFTIPTLDALQAGMPVLSRLSTKQNNNAQPKVEACSNIEASTAGGLIVWLNSCANNTVLPR